MVTYFNAFISGELEPFWPHFWLLSVTILAGAAVAAGIIFDSVEYSASTHRIAKWLVIGGVAVESVCTICLFVFDEGISGAQQGIIRSQQSKIIALENHLGPRTLTGDQNALVA